MFYHSLFYIYCFILRLLWRKRRLTDDWKENHFLALGTAPCWIHFSIFFCYNNFTRSPPVHDLYEANLFFNILFMNLTRYVVNWDFQDELLRPVINSRTVELRYLKTVAQRNECERIATVWKITMLAPFKGTVLLEEQFTNVFLMVKIVNISTW